MTSATSDNIFDALPSMSFASKSGLADELTRYLVAPTEWTTDPLKWWVENQSLYPCLSRMALNYLSIPGNPQSPFSLPFATYDFV
jgi:hypothetical protein